ncbi:MAG: aldo/keto reductase [Alphaproteobacteria bacterium]|nr:aldo/keto reductase [Alphaproteobacteria bacterium]
MQLKLGDRSTGLPRLGFGGAPIGGLLDDVDGAAATAALDAALEGGVRYFDTAPFYGFGMSERRIGDALRGHDDVVLSTKVGRLLKPGLPDDPASMGWPSPLPFHPVYDYSYDGVMRSFEDSLQRLGLDRIDILYIHDIGPFTHTDPEEEARHFEEAMTGGHRALEELRNAGDIAAFGIGVNETEVSLRALDRGDWDVFLLAGRYTLLEQTALDPFFTRCAEQSVSVVIGGPFNSGILVGGKTWNYAEAPSDIVERVTGIKRVCVAHGIPLPAAALQFPLAHPVVSSVIPGTRNQHEQRELLSWWKTEIPSGLWDDLRSENLLDQAAPTPS